MRKRFSGEMERKREDGRENEENSELKEWRLNLAQNGKEREKFRGR